MAILLLDEVELASVQIGTVKQRVLDASASAEASVQVIDADTDFFKQRLPQTIDELSLLCHVRLASHGGETAVVLGGRLPHASDTSHAFLVSVERCYDRTTRMFRGHLSGAKHPSRLVILKAWRFMSGDPDQSLIRHLHRLDHTPLTLQSTYAAPSGVEAPGASLFDYHMRDGSRAAAFCRGPLAPGPVAPPPEVEILALPGLRSADRLIRYLHGLGVFDVTYASAWELGRLLALSAGSFTHALIRWKHHAKGRSLARAIDAEAGHIDFNSNAHETEAEMPTVITGFLEKLTSLTLVPQNYLLPESQALPAESIRFFQIDEHWMRCLIEGSFSIGRFLSNDHEHEVALRTELDRATFPSMGFLLRSDVVSAFPSLIVEGKDLNGNQVLPSVRTRVSPGLLMCAFDKTLAKCVLHPAPEELHCGTPNASPRMVLLSGSSSARFARQTLKGIGAVSFSLTD